MKRHFGTFHDAVKVLRGRVPPALPVKVRRSMPRRPSDPAGTTFLSLKSRCFRIWINAALSEDAQVLVLTHEWAHALAWGMEGDAGPIRHDHDAHWGVGYARVWCAFMAEEN